LDQALLQPGLTNQPTSVKEVAGMFWTVTGPRHRPAVQRLKPKKFRMTVQLPLKAKIPFIDAAVPAGFPSPATDYLETAINIHEEFVPHPLSTFLFTSSGDSMLDAFIPPKAFLLVDRSLVPKTGDIVLAVLQGEFTIKFYERTEKRCRLLPANKNYKPIDITEEMEMQVWGVVTKIIIDPKEVRYVRPC
jgi:DNA polymerase V